VSVVSPIPPPPNITAYQYCGVTKGAGDRLIELGMLPSLTVDPDPVAWEIAVRAHKCSIRARRASRSAEEGMDEDIEVRHMAEARDRNEWDRI